MSQSGVSQSGVSQSGVSQPGVSESGVSEDSRPYTMNNNVSLGSNMNVGSRNIRMAKSFFMFEKGGMINKINSPKNTNTNVTVNMRSVNNNRNVNAKNDLQYFYK